MNIQNICSNVERNPRILNLSPNKVQEISRLSYDQINVLNNESENLKFFIILSKFSKISADLEISLDRLLDLFDLLLTQFNLTLLQSSELNFDFSTLNILILARIQGLSIDQLLNAVIRLTGHQITAFDEVVSVICTKLSFEMVKIFSDPEPRAMNKYLRLLKKILNIPELTERLKVHSNIFLLNSSKFLINQYEANSNLSKTEIRIQQKVNSLSSLLDINLSERFRRIPPPSRRSRVIQQPVIDQKVALYSRSIQNYYDVTIYRLYENGTFRAVKEYSRICSAKAGKIIAKEVDIMQKLSVDAKDDSCYLNVYDVKNSENMISIVMDYYELDLKKQIQAWKKNSIKPSESEIKTIMKKLVESFTELQEKKIFHRDIKPQNILITPNKQPKIIDFNISYKRQLNELTISIQQASIVGTLNYMAPELLEFHDENKKKAEFNIGKADVFSLGLTFWELISLEETNGRYSAKRTKKLLKEIESSQISTWYKELLGSMLKLNPRERKSFRELLMFFSNDETEMTAFQD